MSQRANHGGILRAGFGDPTCQISSPQDNTASVPVNPLMVSVAWTASVPIALYCEVTPIEPPSGLLAGTAQPVKDPPLSQVANENATGNMGSSGTQQFSFDFSQLAGQQVPLLIRAFITKNIFYQIIVTT